MNGTSPSLSIAEIRATIIDEALKYAAVPQKTASIQIAIFNRLTDQYGRDLAELFFIYTQVCMPGNTPQPIRISIVNSTVGNFVLDSQIQNITSNVNAVAQNGVSGVDFASAVKQIVEAATANEELTDEKKKEIVESFEVLAEQAALPKEKRKMVVVKPILEAIPKLLTSANALVTLWHSVGPQITGFF